MKRALLFTVVFSMSVLILLLSAVPTAGALPSDPFLGTWQGVDPADGSFQRLTFGGRGGTRNVVLRDTAGVMCGGGAFVGHGIGTVTGGTLTVPLSIRCVAGTPLADPITVTYTVLNDGTLSDTWSAPFTRR